MGAHAGSQHWGSASSSGQGGPGGQQGVAQVTGSLPPTWPDFLAPGFGPDPAPAVADIWGVNWQADFCLCLSATQGQGWDIGFSPESRSWASAPCSRLTAGAGAVVSFLRSRAAWNVRVLGTGTSAWFPVCRPSGLSGHASHSKGRRALARAAFFCPGCLLRSLTDAGWKQGWTSWSSEQPPGTPGHPAQGGASGLVGSPGRLLGLCSFVATSCWGGSLLASFLC